MKDKYLVKTGTQRARELRATERKFQARLKEERQARQDAHTYQPFKGLRLP